MSDHKKLRICDVLGVEPFQQFGVSGYGEKYFIDYDGEFCAADCACDDGELVFALAEAINNPQSIKRKPRWTAEDIEDAKAIRRLYPNSKFVRRVKMSDGTFGIDIVRENGMATWLAVDLVSSLETGKKAALDEILEAENYV